MLNLPNYDIDQKVFGKLLILFHKFESQVKYFVFFFDYGLFFQVHLVELLINFERKVLIFVL